MPRKLKRKKDDSSIIITNPIPIHIYIKLIKKIKKI
ncbi:hypothetical protein IX314_000201 [Fusobacterium sp. DD26]|nr:hypothetical protein [Fusobacterium sp. DD45]MBR8710233.1 hypothetical protein [Fusobacterium sp. DD28]MBR8750755.1 hypothetical protein [Fusobacterium sp. DD26]